MGTTITFSSSSTLTASSTTTRFSFRFRSISSLPNFNFNTFSSPSSSKPLTLNSNSSSKLPYTLPIPKSYPDDAASSSSTSSSTATSSRNLKSRLHNGETLYGLFLLSFSPTLAEIAGLAGYDFVVIDMEHGHGGIPDALHCMHALAASGAAAILRVPETSSTWAKKALDLGPQGIMFPMIESAKSAKKAVSYCRFPPTGIRGSAHPVVRASGYGIDEGYLNSYLDELLVLCQVESENGVKNVEEIAAVDGVDCVQMGPLDLSASLGYLWDPGNTKVRDVLREAERKVLEGNGKGNAYLSGFALPHDGPLDLKSRGYHMVSGAVDVGLFRSAAVDDVMSFKMSLFGEESDSEHGEGKEDGDEKYWSE